MDARREGGLVVGGSGVAKEMWIGMDTSGRVVRHDGDVGRMRVVEHVRRLQVQQASVRTK